MLGGAAALAVASWERAALVPGSAYTAAMLSKGPSAGSRLKSGTLFAF